MQELVPSFIKQVDNHESDTFVHESFFHYKNKPIYWPKRVPLLKPLSLPGQTCTKFRRLIKQEL